MTLCPLPAPTVPLLNAVMWLCVELSCWQKDLIAEVCVPTRALAGQEHGTGGQTCLPLALCVPPPLSGHLLIESARPAQHTAACRPLVGKVPSPCRWPSGCLQRQPGCVREVLFPALLLAACCVCLTAGPMSTLTLPVVASCPYTLSTWGGLLFEKLFLAFSKK